MSNYIKTNILCLGLLCALSLIACTETSENAQNYGTTEEKNAFWDEASNLKAWNVIDGSEISLDASRNTLAGRVSFDKSSKKGLKRAGIVYDAANSDGSPVDLSQNSGGLCIVYKSDFDVEVRLDDGDYASSSVDKDLPYASFSMKGDGEVSHCVTWEDFKSNGSGSDGKAIAMNVRNVQIVFIGNPGSSGEFDIQRLGPYVRRDMWYGKDGSLFVNTGFDKGDEETSGKWTTIEDSSTAYISWNNDYRFHSNYRTYYYEGFWGDVVFNESASNPDVGFQFLVAGKTTKDGEETIHSADVSARWMGICLQYKSQMDIVMELVPEDAREEDILRLPFAKNVDGVDTTVEDLDDGVSLMENKCYEFANVPNSYQVLKKLTTVRLKFASENRSGTGFNIRRLSYLLPEDLAGKDLDESRETDPADSSDNKSGNGFLWNGAVDGARINLGTGTAETGGVWINNPESPDLFRYNFPDDVKPDDKHNPVPSLVSKYHKFIMYVKTRSAETSIYLDSIAYIGFYTVSSNGEPADISAWGGFCIHYSTYDVIRIAIVTDASENKYWYADVGSKDEMEWAKVSWDEFKNIDVYSDETIEEALGKVTSVQLQFISDGEVLVDKFGSYDRCANK